MGRLGRYYEYGSLFLFKDGRHWQKVVKINNDLGLYEQGQRYTVVFTIRGDYVKIERPYPHQLMTRKQFTKEFRYIRGQQKNSTKENREKFNKGKVFRYEF